MTYHRCFQKKPQRNLAVELPQQVEAEEFVVVDAGALSDLEAVYFAAIKAKIDCEMNVQQDSPRGRQNWEEACLMKHSEVRYAERQEGHQDSRMTGLG